MENIIDIFARILKEDTHHNLPKDYSNKGVIKDPMSLFDDKIGYKSPIDPSTILTSILAELQVDTNNIFQLRLLNYKNFPYLKNNIRSVEGYKNAFRRLKAWIDFFNKVYPLCSYRRKRKITNSLVNHLTSVFSCLLSEVSSIVFEYPNIFEELVEEGYIKPFPSSLMEKLHNPVDIELISYYTVGGLDKLESIQDQKISLFKNVKLANLVNEELKNISSDDIFNDINCTELYYLKNLNNIINNKSNGPKICASAIRLKNKLTIDITKDFDNLIQDFCRYLVISLTEMKSIPLDLSQIHNIVVNIDTSDLVKQIDFIYSKETVSILKELFSNETTLVYFPPYCISLYYSLFDEIIA